MYDPWSFNWISRKVSPFFLISKHSLCDLLGTDIVWGYIWNGNVNESLRLVVGLVEFLNFYSFIYCSFDNLIIIARDMDARCGIFNRRIQFFKMQVCSRPYPI